MNMPNGVFPQCIKNWTLEGLLQYLKLLMEKKKALSVSVGWTSNLTFQIRATWPPKKPSLHIKYD